MTCLRKPLGGRLAGGGLRMTDPAVAECAPLPRWSFLVLSLGPSKWALAKLGWAVFLLGWIPPFPGLSKLRFPGQNHLTIDCHEVTVDYHGPRNLGTKAAQKDNRLSTVVNRLSASSEPRIMTYFAYRDKRSCLMRFFRGPSRNLWDPMGFHHWACKLAFGIRLSALVVGVRTLQDKESSFCHVNNLEHPSVT
ncbi:unnamed protein product [Cuscuta campestris]|uniref:Uncharacterized protein n=1 Tax=Cuscuta campestris TaxID=132261 RepID=A0A484KCR8_9ASTE|nr:unnamed protein product [Cuscuta campestris]